MTLEQFTQRLGASLTLCCLPVFVVAVVCAASGAGGIPQVATLHHLFGLTFAVIGFLLLLVGAALLALVPPRSTTSASGTGLPDNNP